MAVVLAGLLVLPVITMGSTPLGAVAVDNGSEITSQQQTYQEPTPKPTDAWPMFGANPSNTGHIDTTGPTNNITVKWDFSTGAAVESSPAVVNGTVYIGNSGPWYNGSVYALNSTTGTPVWTFGTGGRVTSTPAVANGTVYISSRDNNVYAIDAETGAEKWRFETEDPKSPTVVDGTVYVGARESMYALDALTGKERWTFSRGYGSVQSAPAVVNGSVYVVKHGSLYTLNAETGSVRWNSTYGGTGSSPTVVDGTVYIGEGDYVYALDAKTGNESWNYTTDETFSVKSSAAVVNDTLYVGTGDYPIPEGTQNNLGKVLALYANNGTERWTFEIDEGDDPSWKSSPAVGNRTVYVGAKHNVYALDAEKGTVRWIFETRDKVASSPAVVNGTVYVGSSDTNVYALSEGSSNLVSPTANTQTPTTHIPTPTAAFPETIPGFDVGVWIVGFALLVILLTVHRRD